MRERAMDTIEGGWPEPGATASGSPADDERFMSLALAEADKAAALGEVPVGALVVRDGTVLAMAHNRRETDGDPTAHAELLAIRAAANATGNWRLSGCTLYATIEPCAMCAGAAVLARVSRLVYGAADPKGGACGTLMNVVRDPRLNHQIAVTGGVLEERCAAVIRRFFEHRR
jgi:tRNA(adenine34) deaminase